jgi:drug/metabolite transporter (DMT)-like permease
MAAILIIGLLLLFIAYFCIGLAPLFILPVNHLSPLSFAFFRFFGAACIEFVVLSCCLILLYRQLRGYLTEIHSEKSLKFFTMLKEITTQYYSSPNPYFQNRSQFSFLSWLGFLLIGVVIPTYYLGFTLTGIVITSIAQNILTVLGVALINTIKKEEKMDLLKFIDFGLLITAIIAIAFSSASNIAGSNLTVGILVIILSSAACTIYMVQFGYDHSRKILLLRHYGLPRSKEKNIERILIIVRALLKIIMIHFMGSVILIGIGLFFALIAPDSLLGEISGRFIYIDLPEIGTYLVHPAILSLIIVCSAFPYSLIIFSSVIWPRNALKHSLWTTIFSLMEPLVGLYVGWLVWHETVRPDYIIFVTILIVSAVFIRYFHESINVRHIIFYITHDMGQMEEVLKNLSSIKEVDRIDFLAGDFDFAVYLTVRALPRLTEIAHYIEKIPSVVKSNYVVEDRIY